MLRVDAFQVAVKLIYTTHNKNWRQAFNLSSNQTELMNETGIFRYG
jgi:hypothetical protein